MNMHTPAERVRLRYQAADRQGWLCALCGKRMTDRRSGSHLSPPDSAGWRTSDYRDYYGTAASTLAVGDEIRAACFTCVTRFHGTGRQEAMPLFEDGPS